jgi:hypothetical protein
VRSCRPPLRKLMEDNAPKTMDPDHRKSLLDRLKGVADLFRLSRYQTSRRGTVQADPESETNGFANLGKEVGDPPLPPEDPSGVPPIRTPREASLACGAGRRRCSVALTGAEARSRSRRAQHRERRALCRQPFQSNSPCGTCLGQFLPRFRADEQRGRREAHDPSRWRPAADYLPLNPTAGRRCALSPGPAGFAEPVRRASTPPDG